MIEIRFHGRGGQGSVLAAELLAHAAFEAGLWPQSFPFFGVERRGAPVTAYARLDAAPIRLRTSVTAPDVVVVLEPGLLGAPGLTDGLKASGIVVANSRRRPEELDLPGAVRAATVDATAIARIEGLGSAALPLVNTAMLGALVRATDVVPLEILEASIRAHVPARPDANVAAARAAWTATRVGTVTDPRPAGPPAMAPRLADLPDGPMAVTPTSVLRTAAWRTLWPSVDAARCTRCTFCWKFCPDDAIELDPTGFPTIRAAYCKGCGVCAVECPPHAIAMVPEVEAGAAP